MVTHISNRPSLVFSFNSKSWRVSQVHILLHLSLQHICWKIFRNLETINNRHDQSHVHGLSHDIYHIYNWAEWNFWNDFLSTREHCKSLLKGIYLDIIRLFISFISFNSFFFLLSCWYLTLTNLSGDVLYSLYSKINTYVYSSFHEYVLVTSQRNKNVESKDRLF